MIRRPSARRIGAYLLTALVACALAVTLFAPQIPILLREGFPPPTWPAPGDFAEVTGSQESSAPEMGSALPDQAAQLFHETGGRALLMSGPGLPMIETYAEGLGRDDRLNSYSLVKSLIGVLVLRAVADGRIAALDDDLQTYLGQHAPDITLREALTMTSGLALGRHPEKPMEDGSFSPFGGVARLHALGIDQIMPGLHPEPAIRGSFRYESVNTALLGAALEHVYDEPLPELLSRLIWQPSGAQTAYWRQYPGGHGTSAYCCLYARPLDWLLVGRYLLDNGTETAPFLPEALWQEFLDPVLPAEQRGKGAYGYQIRHDILDRPGEAVAGHFAYFLGHDGQVVYLLPEQRAVVVRFGERQQLLHSTLYQLFAATDGAS